MKARMDKPQMEMVMFEAEDIITSSGGGCSGDCIDVCRDECSTVCSYNCKNVTPAG